MPVTDDLPPALRSMWRTVKLGYRAEPLLLGVSIGISLAAAVPDALFALWLKVLTDGANDHDHTAVIVAALGLGLSATAGWLLRMGGDRVSRRFRDRASIQLEAHVAGLQASISRIEHHERPEYLDRLSVLRDQVFALDHLFLSLFSTLGWIVRLAITVVLLASVHPSLVLLAVFAVPTIVESSWRAGVERRAEEAGAAHARLARHLFTVGSTPPPGKEVRVARVGSRLIDERSAEWRTYYAHVSRARLGTALWQSLAWLIFGAAYVAAIVFVAAGLDASAGDTILVVAAGSRLSQYLAATVGEIGFLRGIWMDSSRRLAWLEDYAAAQLASADQPVPDRLTDGLRFDHVSFHYPGTGRLVLDDVDLHLPAGRVIAIVGENGAGKTTLVKLIARMYEPTTGHITADGTDIGRMPVPEWRARLAGAFQDFFRFEFRAVTSVGLGDVGRHEDAVAVGRALDIAGATTTVEHLPRGLDTQLGAGWPEGSEVSFGQWQKLALARGFMRDEPLVLVLDEPTAALDAETEHELFEGFATAARTGVARQDGRITIFVSHRFSTVRMADLIVVLDGARVVEMGTHEQLIVNGGQYADLYTIQAGAYR
jgi:ATP-binding cassette, subfamily B, bacterial